MNNNRKNNKMTAKETMKTIQELDNQEWEDMKKHIDKTRGCQVYNFIIV